MATEQQLRTYLKHATVELTETRQRLASVEERQREPVAIIGMACRYPGGGETVEGFWQQLREGRSGVTEVPPSRWNVDDYYQPDRHTVGGVYTRHGAFLPDIAGWDAQFFGISPQEALRMDPQQRLLMELVWEGFEDAGAPAARLAGTRTAVMAGYMDPIQYGRVQTERQGMGVLADPYFGQGLSASVVAGRLAYHFDLRGPAVTLDTACSSSLVTVHLAMTALRQGECDLAVAGGASLIMHPDTYVMACATSMLSPGGACKTFDDRADGYVMGEGGGVVVLERLSVAVRNGRRIRAVLRGSAVNQDGRSNGITAPSRGAQVDVIRRAQAAARVAPDDVDYLEAHGSGTRLGDAIELSALQDVFGGRSPQQPLLVGAVKTNIGHTQAAAGVAGLIKTTLLLEHGLVPPNLHLVEPAAAIPVEGTLQPVTAVRPLPDQGRSRIAGVSSFGWSGTNAHVVVESAPAPAAPGAVGAAPAPAQVHVLPVSAASGGALRQSLARLAGWLSERPELDLADVAHTLQTGRTELEHRRALVATDLADATRRLAAAATAGGGAPAKRGPRIAFLLPGVGDQYQGMGRELYRREPVYAEAVDRCVTLVRERSGVDLQPMFFPPEDTGDPLDRAEITHPFLFTVEYALARLLAHWGVKPDVLVGCGLGEYAAACLAGVFSLEDALHVVVARARLIGAPPAGAMVAVAAGADQPVREKLAALLDSVPRQAPTTTIVSTLTGAPLTREQATSASYWAEQLVDPVRFDDCVRHCLAQEVDAFVELGAGQTLGGRVRQNLTGAAGVAVLGTLPARRTGEHPDARIDLRETCGRLWELGVGVDWAATRHDRPRIVGLPTYPFQRTRFWPGRADPGPADPGRVAPVPPGTRGGPADAGYAPAWQQDTLPGGSLTAAGARPPGPLVVFADPAGIGGRLADAAAAAGTPVVEVVPGDELRRDGRRLVIDPTEPDHYREVFGSEGLGSEVPGGGQQPGPVQVVHLWSLHAPARIPGYAGDEELREVVRYGFDSLLLAVQALGELPAQQGVRLLTVSQGAAEILGGDVPAPHQAAVHGLGRAVRHEYAGLTWSGVDLDPAAVPEAAARQLGYELRRPPKPGGAPETHETLAGWRRGRRWGKGWGEIGAGASQQAGPPWRTDGVYLITGGTRGLGMALAKHLVRAGVRRLALVGRTPLPPDAPPDPDPRAARSRRDIAELEAAGAEVLRLTADAGVPSALREALRCCRDHFGALHGVVHAAGVPAGGMAQRRTVAQARAVLAPKVFAMGPLAELVGPHRPAPERPELLVLYSSAVTAFGGIGESDYCAANTVLDAYGEALAATAPSTRVVTVAWGPWQHDDWQAEGLKGAAGLAARVRAYRQRYGFADEAGCAFLDRLVTGGHGSVLALRQPLRDVLRDWSSMIDLDALVAAAPAAPRGERFPRPQLRTEFVGPRTGPENTIAEVWGAYLGIDQVGVHDPFFDLGGNSLVGMAMVLAVEKKLGVSIAPAVLFEHPTVADFAAAVAYAGGAAGRDGAAATQQQVLSTSSARGQRRRARSGARR